MRWVLVVLLLSGCTAPVVCPVAEPVAPIVITVHRKPPAPLPLPPVPPSTLDLLRAALAP